MTDQDPIAADIQGLRTEVVALTTAVNEHKESFHREITRMDTSLKRYHERVDRNEDAVALMQQTLSKIDADRVNRVVNRMDYLFSTRALLKAATVIGTAAVIGSQIIAFIQSVS